MLSNVYNTALKENKTGTCKETGRASPPPAPPCPSRVFPGPGCAAETSFRSLLLLIIIIIINKTQGEGRKKSSPRAKNAHRKHGAAEKKWRSPYGDHIDCLVIVLVVVLSER